MTTDHSLVPGDLLRIERRYLVDGVLQLVTDHGRFEGVKVVGSAEHLALKDAERKEVRLFPLHAISEITLVKPARRVPVRKQRGAATAAAWDPGVV